MQIMPSAEEGTGAYKPAARYQHPGKGQTESKVLPTPSIEHVFTAASPQQCPLCQQHFCGLLKPLEYSCIVGQRRSHYRAWT